MVRSPWYAWMAPVLLNRYLRLRNEFNSRETSLALRTRLFRLGAAPVRRLIVRMIVVQTWVASVPMGCASDEPHGRALLAKFASAVCVRGGGV